MSVATNKAQKGSSPMSHKASSTLSPVVTLAEAMSLHGRVDQFRQVITSTEITDIKGIRRDTEKSIADLVASLKELRSRGNHMYIVGNGGSAGVAAHSVTDFLNVAKLKAATLHDSSLLTCMSNDYGYESAFARILSTMASAGDLLVAISSSGQSANIRNAATEMRRLGGNVITLSGFKRDNPLRTLGDVNLWLDSNDYGMVEIGHQFFLHNLADRIRLGM
jgi:D-sedoheptulose 7-phosphate isomerase